MSTITENTRISLSLTVFGMAIGVLIGAILWASGVAAEANIALNKSIKNENESRLHRDSLIRIEARLGIYNKENWNKGVDNGNQ